MEKLPEDESAPAQSGPPETTQKANDNAKIQPNPTKSNQKKAEIVRMRMRFPRTVRALNP
jgi:hypothetical protein